MRERIQKLLDRLEEVEQLLGSAQVLSDLVRYRNLMREHSFLSGVKVAWERYEKLEKDLEELRRLIKEETDPAFIEEMRKEIPILEEQFEKALKDLKLLLVPPDPRDSRNTILEIRAGTGGDEAALFVGDCVRMYKGYAAKKGWNCEHLSSAPSERGGFKEYIFVLSGKDVHRFLQYEAGTHRVQRVPDTESQGRVHTSAITVAVLLEPDETEKVHLDESELKIDTFRASGAGGQHVNVTDSAVRITHIPTGITVSCQEERSQHKNKEKALRLLEAKIGDREREKALEETASLRSSQIGSGDRSERIRTYNFPQNRVTDHRIGLTVYQLDRMMEGELDVFTEPLVAHFYEQQLATG